MSSRVSEGEPCSAAEGSERAHFLANMVEGLHAMAQPLTILRSTIAASAAPSVDPIKFRRYLELSQQQIERACNLFDMLQSLVIASQTQVDYARIDLAELLATVATDLRSAFQASGVELRIAPLDGLPTVVGDATKMQHAVSATLEVLASASVAGDVVELLTIAGDHHVEVIVRNERVRGGPLNSLERFSLLVAQTNILGQQGQFEYTDDPLCVRIALSIQNGQL
jgi:hypothetical protein